MARTEPDGTTDKGIRRGKKETRGDCIQLRCKERKDTRCARRKRNEEGAYRDESEAGPKVDANSTLIP